MRNGYSHVAKADLDNKESTNSRKEEHVGVHMCWVNTAMLRMVIKQNATVTSFIKNHLALNIESAITH